jgi:hypothetical protein
VILGRFSKRAGNLPLNAGLSAAMLTVLLFWGTGSRAPTKLAGNMMAADSGVVTDSVPVGMRATASRGGHPNEPPGYVRFAENDGSVLESREPSEHVFGQWEARRDRRPVPHLQVREDNSAPTSPPTIVRTRFPAQQRAGSAPVSWSGWDEAGNSDGQKSKVYLSLWMRIPTPDYENQEVGTKWGFLAYGRDPARSGSALNDGYFLLVGGGRQAIRSAFRMRFHQQGFVERVLDQNVMRRPVFTCGQWHHLEVVAEVNSPGARNGIFRMWVDGQQIMNYSDVVYTTPERRFKFTGWKWNPTWGGREGVKTREDLVDFDHVYISGVP